MLTKFKKKTKSLLNYIWLILLIIISVFVIYINDRSIKSHHENLKKTLNNVYFQKVITKVTSELENRFTEIEYIVKAGDTYESIINNIEISNNEKKLFIQTIKKNKKIEILRPKQKNLFKN